MCLMHLRLYALVEPGIATDRGMFREERRIGSTNCSFYQHHARHACRKRAETEEAKMKHYPRTLRKGVIALSVALLSLACTNAAATWLSGTMNVDDRHQTFISTSDGEAGTLIAEGDWWPDTDSFSDILLVDGQDYFLHVLGQDAWKVITGFIGEFHLLGDGHRFANGKTSITTNSVDWAVSTTGWGDYVSATEHYDNGTGPWASYLGGPIADISADAKWIWSDDARAFNDAYFTAPIFAKSTPVTPSTERIPEPTTLALIGLGIAGLTFRQRRRRSVRR